MRKRERERECVLNRGHKWLDSFMCKADVSTDRAYVCRIDERERALYGRRRLIWMATVEAKRLTNTRTHVNTSGGKQRDFLKGSAEQKWHKKITKNEKHKKNHYHYLVQLTVVTFYRRHQFCCESFYLWVRLCYSLVSF